jgi:outer membrane receptor protein involved in Fe transport
VQQTYNGQLLSRPFIAKHRAFASVDYATNKEWKFNYTLTYNGKKRIPSTAYNPSIYQFETVSPDYVLMNAQISKSYGKTNRMDFYMGVENITNTYQQNLILAADTPFSPYFDASMIWGPTNERMWYFGWRFKIK